MGTALCKGVRISKRGRFSRFRELITHVGQRSYKVFVPWWLVLREPQWWLF